MTTFTSRGGEIITLAPPMRKTATGWELMHTAQRLGASPPTPDLSEWSPSLDKIGYATATTTGLRAGWTEGDLTVVVGNQTITTPNTVIKDKYIKGNVFVRTTGVVIDNCVIETQVHGTGDSACVDCNHTAVRNCVVQHCVLRQSPASVWFWYNGLIGHDYTVRYCNVYDCVDGFGVYNNNSGFTTGPTNVVIENNYLHDMLCWRRTTAQANADPANGGPEPHTDQQTHNDGVQMQGGTGTIIRGNTFDCRRSPKSNYAGLIGQVVGITQNVSAVSGSLVQYNYLNGGANANFIAIPGSKGASNIGTVKNNRSGRDGIYDLGSTARPRIRIDTPLTYTDLSDNVFADTGAAVPMQLP